MTKSQKQKLLGAINTLHMAYLQDNRIKLGASRNNLQVSQVTHDKANRPYPSTWLAQRAQKYSRKPQTPVTTQIEAQKVAAGYYGLTASQLAKLDRTACSTHNLKQRTMRVLNFLRHVYKDSSYIGKGGYVIEMEGLIPNILTAEAVKEMSKIKDSAINTMQNRFA